MVPDVVLDHIALLGEGPVWDHHGNTICWVDIEKGEIHQFAVTTGKFHTLFLNQLIGSLALSTNGKFIAALQHGFAFIDRENGKMDMITDPEQGLPNNRFNDGKCDPQGRFWAGSMSLSEEPHAGNLYMIGKSGVISKKIEQVTISNGLAWSSDRLLYYIDTPTRSVVSYTFNVETGNISNKKLVLTIDQKEGFPDGMTIDTEDHLWIAHWDGWQVSRWNPRTGKKVQHVKLPVARITSCCFGGNAFQDLYITTASTRLSPSQLKEQPLAGMLFVLKDCGYTGLKSAEFIW